MFIQFIRFGFCTVRYFKIYLLIYVKFPSSILCTPIQHDHLHRCISSELQFENLEERKTTKLLTFTLKKFNDRILMNCALLRILKPPPTYPPISHHHQTCSRT